ncbi:MAG: TlyA family RNA methyltransferase [Bacillota bacterium]
MGARGDGPDRRRLDALLVERGLAASRTEAQALVVAGRVRAGGRAADKPGRRYPASVDLEVERPPHRYVSRGGLKLEKALDQFGLDVTGLSCLDVGASTGGFTDCLLQRGAGRVYAVDVGYGLLAWKLRSDDRVIPLDRTNARYLDRESFRRAVEAQGRDLVWPALATIDVSFISLLKVTPAVVGLLEPPWQIIALVKPQFEAGRTKVGSGGVVRDPETHVGVLEKVTAGLAAIGPADVAGLTPSPVRGPEGNVEYLLWLVGPSDRPEGGHPAPEAIRKAVSDGLAVGPVP